MSKQLGIMASALAALLLVGVLRVVQPPHSVSPSLSNDHIVDNVGSHEGDGGPLKGVPTSDGTITTPAVGTTKTSATNAVAAQLRHPSARHVAADVPECPQGDVTFNSAASETISTNLTGFAMSLTNSSSTPCSLAGYPTITWGLLARDLLKLDRLARLLRRPANLSRQRVLGLSAGSGGFHPAERSRRVNGPRPSGSSPPSTTKGGHV
jgi:hypothetical protein